MSDVRRSVSRLPSGKWRARYYDPDTSRWVALGSHRTKNDAHDAINQAVGELRAGLRPVDAGMTFGTYADDLYWPNESVAPKTLQDQLAIFENHIRPRWGDVKLVNINVEDVEQWVRVELPARPSVRNPKRTIGTSLQRSAYWVFHKIVAKAHERGYVPRNPLPRRSGLPAPQPSKPTRILAPDEVELFARAVNEKDPSLIHTMASGGFRVGELFALRVDDLDFDRCSIAVDEQVQNLNGRLEIVSVLKRPRSHRVVPMPTIVMEMLHLHLRGRDDDPRALVFPNASDGPWDVSNWRRRVFDPAWRAAGIQRLTPHDLRHTAASAWFDEGVDIVTVARLLGDSLAVAERTYVHLYTGRHDGLQAAMDARIARGRGQSNVTALRPAAQQRITSGS